MALLISVHMYEHCTKMERAIVDCIDVNWNRLILDRIQREAYCVSGNEPSCHNLNSMLDDWNDLLL